MKLLTLKPLDSLFFGGGKGVPLSGDSSSLYHPLPWTVSGALITLAYSKGLNVISKSEWSEEEEERCDILNYAFYGPFVHYKGMLWVPAPRDFVIKEFRMSSPNKIEFMLLEQAKLKDAGDGYHEELPPLVLSQDDYHLYDHVRNPLVPLSSLKGPTSVVDPPVINGEGRIGIKLDRSRGVVEAGMLYRTTHIRVPEDFSYAMVPFRKVNGRPEISSSNPLNLTGVVRLGGEGRPSLVKTVESEELESLMNSKVSAGKVVRVILVAPAIYLKGEKTVSLPDLKGLPGNPSWVGPQVVTGKPIRVSGWSLASGRAKRMFSAVPSGTVYYLKVEKEVTVSDFLAEFWRLSLYWDRGFGSPLLEVMS